MQKIRNREKFTIKSSRFIYVPVILILFILLAFFLYKNNFKNFLLENIQSKSEQFGYTLKIIEIKNTEYLSKDKVNKIILPNINKSIFFISLKSLRKEILNLKWVNKLNLKIDYPSRLIIEIEEKIPSAIYREKNKNYYIDEYGNKIDLVQNLKDYNLILIYGNDALIDASNLIKHIKLYNKIKVVSAEYIGSRRWDLITKNNIRIKMPERDLNNALKNLNDIYLDIEKLKNNIVNYVDLRLPKKAIIMFNNKETIDILTR